MHELSVCQDVISQVEQIAGQHEAISVASIEMQIGPLSGVEVSLLESAFTIACSGTIAETATLKIESMPIKVKCKTCGKSSEASTNNLSCSHCGNWQTTLISGDEMILKRIEMDTEH